MIRIFPMIAAFAAVVVGAAAHAERVPENVFEDRAFDAVTADELETFRTERDFRRYLTRVATIARQREEELIEQQLRDLQELARFRPPVELIPASWQEEAEAPFAPCPPEQPECADRSGGPVVVTGSRVSGPQGSITNNQLDGVDEGDIVKQIGNYLLILQDGRISSIDLEGGAGAMRLADRIDVYRSRETAADWYDEMLVEGDRVLVTAYSYREDASEISVFRLDRETGRLAREGIFLITSDDYYSVDNYATRIVGDRLVIYTPYLADQFANRDAWPVVRRWTPEADFRATRTEGRRLFDARSIYRPIQRTAEPFVHTVSICPLGSIEDGGNLECRSTAFIAPGGREFFVSPEAVYVWTVPSWDDYRDPLDYDNFRDWQSYTRFRNAREASARQRCEAAGRVDLDSVVPSAIYKIPIDGGALGVAGTVGVPFDQFSMDSRDGEFRALEAWFPADCVDVRDVPEHVSYLRVRHGAFGNVIDRARDGRYDELPTPDTSFVENRFTDDYLVYGSRESWSGAPPGFGYDDDEADTAPRESLIVSVPVDRPQDATSTRLPHNIIRIERVGPSDVLLNGYRDAMGLSMTLLSPGGADPVAATAHLANRFESESRSHAFNSLVSEDGNGFIGVPTVTRAADSDRWWWRSDSSDVSYLTLMPGRGLDHIGELHVSAEDPTDPAYRCEESCIDWYGNSRPIFTLGRVFGLMGIELVEGRVENGRIREIRRLNLTTPVAGR